MLVLLRNGSLTIALKQGDATPSDETRIKNPTDLPIWVKGLRFALRLATPTQQGEGSTGIGGAIGVKLNVGGTPLMQNYVPIWLLRTQTTDQELTIQGTQYISRFTWMFKKPMLLLPGQYLSPTFNYTGMLSTSATNPATVPIQITMLADIAEHLPRTVSVPWVCAWQAQKTTAGAAALALPESLRTDLFNPHDFPLQIDRLSGRILLNQIDGDSDDSSSSTAYASANTNVRMFREDGSSIIRDPTAFAHVFSQPLKAWRMENAVMPPRSYYQAVIDVDYSDTAQYGVGTVIQPMIGLLGYRDIPLEQFGRG